MKVFLTFLAFVIVNVNAMVYHDDLRACRALQNRLDTAAETCAGGVSMYYDREAYAEGFLRFDAQEALRYMEHVRTELVRQNEQKGLKAIHMRMYLYGDTGTCVVLEDGEISGEFSFTYPLQIEKAPEQGRRSAAVLTEPSVEVQLFAEIEDPFRQPFLTVRKLAAGSIYSSHPGSGA